MRNIIKKFTIQLLLVFAITLSLISPVNAQQSVKELTQNPEITLETILQFESTLTEDDLESNQYLLDVIEDMKEIASQSESIPLSDFIAELDKEESINNHLNDVQEEKSIVSNSFKLSFADEQQLKRIDALAQEHYDYYIQHGEFPSESTEIKLSSLTDDSVVLSVPLTSQFLHEYSSIASVGILSGLGLSYTEATLASRLGTLGVIAALDGPMPVGDFIALLGGVVILGAYVYNYIDTATSTAIVNNVKVKDGATFSQKTQASITMSRTLKNSSNTVRYFAAKPYKGPGGGIIIEQAISYSVAALRANTLLDTYAKSLNEAFAVAQAATAPGRTAIYDNAHVYNEYNQYMFPNNKPHYHAIDGKGDRKLGHHWF